MSTKPRRKQSRCREDTAASLSGLQCRKGALNVLKHTFLLFSFVFLMSLLWDFVSLKSCVEKTQQLTEDCFHVLVYDATHSDSSGLLRW